ncbi:MAG: hypothetical protein KAS32_29100 [Candidatus Peribacteraceae bacterium]|nr:hypothetical protein [Candidatus Peribacteraceae bacterium]
MEVKPSVYEIKDILRSVERLNHACEDNMKRLNMMMLELKGLIAAVRPQVKKSGWYGEELEGREVRAAFTKETDDYFLEKLDLKIKE